MFLALLTLSLLTDVAPWPAKRPAPPPSQCVADTDCVLSTFTGCCGGCCGSAPHAIPRGVNEAARCAAVDCAPPNCAAVRCEPAPDPSQFMPACRGGRCVAVPKVQPPAECRVNADCGVVTGTPPPGASCHRSPCGCCPVTQALPIDAVVPLQKRPAGVDPKTPGKPDFGLSTGGPTPPQAPSCSPCPAPTGGVAACQAGRCVLLQQPIPRPFPRPPG